MKFRVGSEVDVVQVSLCQDSDGDKLGEIAEDHTISVRYVSHILTKVRKTL